MTEVKGYKQFSNFYIFFCITIIKSCDKLLLTVMDCFSSFNKTFPGLSINVKILNYFNKYKVTLFLLGRKIITLKFCSLIIFPVISLHLVI